MSGGTTRPAPTRDLDTPEEIAEMVRRFYQDRAKAHAEALMAGMAKHVFGFTWRAPDPAEAATGRVGR